MRLAPEVERRKVARELAILEHNATKLRERGAIVLAAAAAKIDVLIMPAQPVRLLCPLPVVLGQSSRQAQIIHDIRITARPFVVRFDLAGYDQRPPSIDFCDPQTMASSPSRRCRR